MQKLDLGEDIDFLPRLQGNNLISVQSKQWPSSEL